MTDLMPWEDATQYVNPLDLIQSQQYQRWVLRAMWDATNDLKVVRDLEVAAEQEYQSARRRTFFNENCPVVVRGGVTVAEQAAKDRMDTIRAQAVLISALAKTTAYIHGVVGANR